MIKEDARIIFQSRGDPLQSGVSALHFGGLLFAKLNYSPPRPSTHKSAYSATKPPRPIVRKAMVSEPCYRPCLIEVCDGAAEVALG